MGGQTFRSSGSVSPDPGSRTPDLSQMATKDTYERISIDIVAAAKATFAQGRRTEAIEMLRRFDLGRRGKAAVAEALQALMAEQQRLIEEERGRVRAAVDEHLSAAEGLVASGMLPEAWARACDALHLDPNDPTAIALEGRIRKALDEQAGRVVPPEQPNPPVDREREAAGATEEPRRLEPEPLVGAAFPTMTSQTEWWLIAVVVALAVLLMAVAVRAC